ncbi:hypothetical protein SprV_0200581500 [Sparganum proliferum]
MDDELVCPVGSFASTRSSFKFPARTCGVIPLVLFVVKRLTAVEHGKQNPPLLHLLPYYYSLPKLTF